MGGPAFLDGGRGSGHLSKCPVATENPLVVIDT